MLPEQGLFSGSIRHQRYHPKPHEFSYRMYWTLLDLDQLESTFSRSRFWSLERWNLLSFRRRDYHHAHPGSDLKAAVTDTIAERTGKRFQGRMQVLTHLRFLGFNFNSVTFYFCSDDTGLRFIVAEITNTPWGEQHLYVLDCERCQQQTPDFYQFEFSKQFHISPFITMDMTYRWGFKLERDGIRIHMVNLREDGSKIFDATFTSTRTPLSKAAMRWIPLRRPWQPLKMIAAIYWQALRLWLKRIPFVEHPHNKTTGDRSSDP